MYNLVYNVVIQIYYSIKYLDMATNHDTKRHKKRSLIGSGSIELFDYLDWSL